MSELIGKLLGRVRIDMFIAHGGMADVYLGTHTTLQRGVAVKLMKNDIQNEPDLLDRFQREARVVAMLRHPNIVQMFDFDTHLGRPFLVMEYISGPSLGTYLRKLHENNERLELTQVSLLLNKLADALNYAHDKGVIHRDVKPGNILLTSRTTPVTVGKPLPSDVEPVVTDFGLVRFKTSTKQTATGVITGTPAYMSPEQAQGRQVDARTDVYSLGVTVYEMLAGRVPFDSDSTLTVLHMHIYEAPPPIDGLSNSLQNVIFKALAKDPADRFQTPLEFAQAFEAALYEIAEAPTFFQSPAATAKITQSLPRSAKKTQNQWVQYALGFGLVALIGIFAVIRLNDPVAEVTTITVIPTSSEGTGESHGEGTPATSPSGESSEAPVVGLFRFTDGTSIADRVTLSTTDMPLPPEGSHYEAWLIEEGGEQRRSVGTINFDADGAGTLTFADSQGRNLLGLYHGLEITLEPNPDPSPNPSNEVLYLVNLPPGGLNHVRHLLYSFGGAPDKKALIQGLETDVRFISEAAQSMLTSYQSGDQAQTRLLAEEMLNNVVGNQSPDYKDWDGNGTIDDLSDGFGLLLNGENSGYIQGVYSHADFAATAEDATQNMIVHGEHVKIAATNLAEWTPQLRDQLILVLTSPAGPELENAVRQAVVWADQLQNGIDLNGDEKVSPVPGEGGALTAYEHAYYMADITIHSDSQP